jgi:hypothetical protein
MLNPVTIATGLYDAARHPIDTVKNLGQAQIDQGSQAWQAAKEFRGREAIGHAGAATLPILGPMAAAAGEQIASGDVAGGLGKGLGLTAAVAAPGAVKAGGKVFARLPAALRTAAADSLEAGAARRVVDVAAPKVGANKLRFTRQAQKLAPELLDKGEAGAWSREGLHANVKAGLTAAEQALDEAADARNAGAAFDTKPVLDELQARRGRLVAQAVEGDRLIPSLEGEAGRPLPAGTVRDVQSGQIKPPLVKEGRPIGQDVVPGPNAARVEAIDQAIDEIRQLGPQARYESLRRIRQAYDGPAKAIYNPSMTADFLKAQGGKLGAADVSGALREALGTMDPATAAANAEYSLYRGLDDVLEAAKETEAARPKVGRRIMSATAGMVTGGAAGGLKGAAIGTVLGPIADAAASAGWTVKLQVAQGLKSLASAVRTGDLPEISSLSLRLKQLTAGNAVGRATSPSGSQVDPSPRRSGQLPPLRPSLQ